ncbi:MAG: M10 family metallopeptidase [Pseudoruegeria sp.]
MTTNFESLLAGEANGWHDGSDTLTYFFFQDPLPDYLEIVDTDGDDIPDTTDVSGYNDLIPFGSDPAMTAAEQALALEAIAAWNAVANINLVAADPGTTGDLGLGSHAFVRPNGKPDQSFGFVSEFPDGGVLGIPSFHGDLWINSNNNLQDVSLVAHTSWATYLHELGHALGLSHPDEDPYNDDGTATNSNQYTVMSYVEHPGVADEKFADQAWPLTPMLYDIQAIQSLYGANTEHLNGDTVYFGSTGIGTETAFATDDMIVNDMPMILTIWDGGGVDTIDASIVDSNSEISLRNGAFSSIGSLVENVAIAYAVQEDGEIVNLIENAIGGGGDDTITGNQGRNHLSGGAGDDLLKGRDGADQLLGGAGTDTLFGHRGRDVLRGNQNADILKGGRGEDRLIGGNGADELNGQRGDDRITGGSGADQFIFSKGSGRDVITDFDTGADMLHLDAALLGAEDTAAQVLNQYATLHDRGVTLNFGEDRIVLLNVTDISTLETQLLIA